VTVAEASAALFYGEARECIGHPRQTDNVITHQARPAQLPTAMAAVVPAPLAAD